MQPDSDRFASREYAPESLQSSEQPFHFVVLTVPPRPFPASPVVRCSVVLPPPNPDRIPAGVSHQLRRLDPTTYIANSAACVGSARSCDASPVLPSETEKLTALSASAARRWLLVMNPAPDRREFEPD